MEQRRTANKAKPPCLSGKCILKKKKHMTTFLCHPHLICCEDISKQEVIQMNSMYIGIIYVTFNNIKISIKTYIVANVFFPFDNGRANLKVFLSHTKAASFLL